MRGAQGGRIGAGRAAAGRPRAAPGGAGGSEPSLPAGQSPPAAGKGGGVRGRGGEGGPGGPRPPEGFPGERRGRGGGARRDPLCGPGEMGLGAMGLWVMEIGRWGRGGWGDGTEGDGAAVLQPLLRYPQEFLPASIPSSIPCPFCCSPRSTGSHRGRSVLGVWTLWRNW